MSKQKKQIEYRYYEIPAGHYVLPLLGEKWEMFYGSVPATMQHFHNYMEIGYCYWGNGELKITEKSYHYSGNLLTIIPQNIPHTTTSIPGGICKWEFLFIDVDSFIRQKIHSGRMSHDELIKQINKEARVIPWQEHPALAAIVKNIIEEYRTQKPHYREAVNGYLTALIVELLRLCEERDLYELGQSKLNQYIEDSIAYIQAHYSEDLKVPEIARNCGLSESHFRKIFEDTVSMKPLDYLNMIRIDNACTLLEQENYSVEEIGLRVGYQAPSSFTRNFKKLTGLSPLQWKKEAKSKSGVRKNYKISAKKGW